MFRRRERNDVQETAVLSAGEQPRPKAPHHRISVGRHEMTQPRTKGRYALSLKLDDASFNSTICAKLIEETRLRGTIRRAQRPKERPEARSARPCPTRMGGASRGRPTVSTLYRR